MKELRATLLAIAALGLSLLLWQALTPTRRPLFPFAGAPDLRTLHLRNGEGSVRLRHDPSGWWLEAPRRRADPLFLEALLDPLRRAEGQVKAPTARAVHGLGSPVASLRWTRPGAHGELRVGLPTPSEEGRFVSTGAGSPVWVLSRPALAPLFAAPTAFRSLAPCPLSTASIARIEVRDLRLTRRMMRKADGSWIVEAPFHARARRGAVAELLNTLASLRASAVASEAPSSLLPFGLNRPNVRLQAWDDENRPLLTLDLGRRLPRQGERVWLRSSLDSAVFECEGRPLLPLTEDVNRLHPGDLLAVPREEVDELALELKGRSWAWKRASSTPLQSDRARRLIDMLRHIPVERIYDAPGMADADLALDSPEGLLRIKGKAFDHEHVIGRPQEKSLHLRQASRVLQIPSESLWVLESFLN